MSYEAAEPESGPEFQAGRSVERQLSGDDRSVGDLMADIGQNLSQLMQQEVALAKAEVQQTAKRTGRGVGMYAGAGVAGHFVLLFLSLALWWAIAHLLSANDPMFGWSAVIVAVIWGIIAAVLASRGKSEMKKVQGAPQTADTVGKIPNALKGEEAKNR
jgi:hypothetical protein